MRKIYTSADQLIGKTPLLELVHIEKSEGLEARVLGKLEYFNPAGSVKASKRTKNPRKSKAVRCEAVLPEQKCSQTRKRPQRILCVFSRALTQYEGISARQNRVCPCQSTRSYQTISLS